MAWRLVLGKLLRKKRHTAHIILEQEGKYLLVQEAVGGIKGLWGLPGGGVGKGEMVEFTAQREAKEETGFDVKLLRKLGEIEDTKRGNVRHIFLSKVRGGKLMVDKKEHMDARWMTLQEIKNLGNKFGLLSA